ncbi:PAS domain S-box protein [Pelotalea chapellei]|uniref:histidine kinase n=1 Tax=Pelotalea chapellei TaxID=44671 RepID=A0ABS5U6J2_9BACT|nr:PAS domain S-box protein [Pelotalea chapellei]MBT1071271.1 PAS domain S-box protein [Pelotalea chapellei]
MDQTDSGQDGVASGFDFKALASLALDAAQDQVFWVDAVGRVIYANHSTCSTLEYSQEELLTMTVGHFCPDLTAHKWAEYWQQLKSAGQMASKVRQRSRLGKYYVIEVSATYLHQEGKEFSCIFGRKTAPRTCFENDLTGTKQQLETIVDTMQAGLIMVDPQGIITFANQRMADMFGYPLAELIGTSYSEHVHPTQRNVGDERMHRLIAGDIDHVHHERYFMRRDGRTFWGHLSGRRLEDSQGKMISLVGVIADISEIKQAEEDLKKREQQFTSLAENLPDIVARIDRAHRYVYINRQIEAVSGSPAEFFFGKNHWELGFNPELIKLWVEAVTKAFDTGEIVNVRFEYEAETGIRHFESRVVPERNNDGVTEFILSISRDVTDSMRAEKQLRESEERYRTIIENMQDVYYRSDAEGQLIMVSPSGVSLLGYDNVDQVLGLNIRNTFYYDPMERDAFLHNLRLKGQVNGYELNLKRRDGTPLPVATSSRLLFAADGTFTGVEGIYRDISLFRKAMDQLRASEEKFERAFKHAPVLMAINDVEDGRFLEINDRSLEISGFSREEVLGRTPLEIGWISPSGRNQIISILKRDGRIQDFELVLAAKDGTPIYCLYSAELITVEGKDRLLSIALDLTQRRKIEESLSHSQKLIFSIVENAPSAYFVKDVQDNFRIVLWNKAAEKIFDLPAIDMIGKNDHDVWPKEQADIYLELDRTVVATRTPLDIPELICTHASRGTIYLRTRKVPLFDNNGNVSHLVVICDDITQHRMMLAEIVKNQKLESLGVLAGGIAHDFNNILTGVIGNISFARAFLDKDHKSTKILLKAEKAANRAADLAQQLLTFAKGSQPIKQPVSIRVIIAESASFVLRGSNVSITIEIPNDLPAVEADEGQLGQVFNNLIINASQSMPEGGAIIIRGRQVTVTAADGLLLAPGRYVQVRVTDTGCGISEKDQKRIFDPYFSTKLSGSGLGLASAHSIITQHGGSITVISEVAKGTTFELLLPVSDKQPVQKIISKESVTLGEKMGLSVLVMDDEEIIRDMTSMILEELGYQSQTCASGEEAVALYKAAQKLGTPYSAAIMDLTIPGGMGGKEAAQHILEIDPHARLIVSSGYSADAIMADYAKFGFCATLLKPYSVEEIIKVLGTVLLNRCS